MQGQLRTNSFLKSPYPGNTANCSSSNSSAWVSALYDGLTWLLQQDNILSTDGVGARVSRSLCAMQGLGGDSTNGSCLVVPGSGTESLYSLASTQAVVAAMSPNTTNPQLMNRMVALTASPGSDGANLSTNDVSYATISVNGQPGDSALSWNDWSVDCEVLFWTEATDDS